MTAEFAVGVMTGQFECGMCRVASACRHCDAHNCTSGCHARNRKHNNIARVLAKAAKDAGLEATREPDTHGLLLEEFTKEECRRIFPRQPSQDYKEAFLLLQQAIEHVRSPECKLDKTGKEALLKQRLDAMPALSKKDLRGLRIDINIVNPTTEEARWIDVTAVSTSSPSYVRKEAEHICARDGIKDLMAGFSAPMLRATISPVIAGRERQKREKYANLVAIANRQHERGSRAQKPQFVAFVITNTGELGNEATDLMEWLVAQYKAKCLRSGPRDDGLTVKELVTSFRKQLYLNIQMELANGVGLTINQSGLYRTGH